MSSNEVTDQQELDALFPVPSLPPSPLSPQRFPGSGLESVAALQRVLKDNHNRYHIFFNYTHFHDHVGYRALAIYALGGSASLIKDYYEQDGKNQRLAVKSPGPITEGNFVEHLGDENSQNIVGSFYQGYVTFFSKQIDEKGAAGTLEEFIFSERYNFQDGRDATRQPEMLFRLMDGLFHPMIHGMLAEGLALCAVEAASERGLYPPSPFVPIPTAEVHGTGPPVFNAQPATAAILSKIGGTRDFVHQWKDVLAELGTVIRRYTEMWTVDLTEPGEIERKMEELIWVSPSLVLEVSTPRKSLHRISTCTQQDPAKGAPHPHPAVSAPMGSENGNVKLLPGYEHFVIRRTAHAVL
ncbi:hypothetical protein BU15DRAFT_64439 [Melanogaster broomeanus]|nr:hypothetical protein BU15DRAFT_64439 [Melanogaster broomeanus]